MTERAPRRDVHDARADTTEVACAIEAAADNPREVGPVIGRADV